MRARDPQPDAREGLAGPLGWRRGADDFVICCKGTAEEAMTVTRGMMSRLKLTVNETKTRLCRLPDESFDFLGYTLGRTATSTIGSASGCA